MNKEQFLNNLAASKVRLYPLQIDGWEGLVYMRPQTMGEVRDALMRMEDKPGEAAATTVQSAAKKDPLFIARSIARIVRDEQGALLFDPDSDAEMEALMSLLADAGPAISKQINEAYNALNEPAKKVEVTPEGNSPSANSS